MENILFQEKQQFRQTWLWLLLIGILLVALWSLVQQVVLQIPFGNNPAPDFALVLFTLLPLVFIWLFGIMYLKTEITNEEIRVQFYPFLSKTINWEEVEEAYVRQYKPLAEFGGWGIRFSTRGKAYNVSGNMGLQLVLKNGKRILIGTQLPEEMESVINIIRPFVK